MNRLKADVCNGILQRNIREGERFQREHCILLHNEWLPPLGKYVIIMQGVELGETRRFCKALQIAVPL